MALVTHSPLPAFDTMQAEGVELIPPQEAVSSGRPDISVGLLNLMPDAAMRATDRQFVRLLSAGAGTVDVWVYPFTVAVSARGEDARRHVDGYYSSFEDVSDRGLDALIVTGANPAQHLLEREPFWEPLGDVLDWAKHSTRSVLCSCLATHAVVERYDGVRRTRLPDKRWGVYEHRVVAEHPLLDGLEDPVVAPHSHWYDMTRHDFESIEASVLLESDEAGVHMAVGADDRFVFFQGHPEYDRVSLLKEYRRELGRYYSGERPEHPPVPEHYFDDSALARLDAYRLVLEEAKDSGRLPPPLDENELLPKNAPDWNTAGQVIYRNWLSGLLG